MYLLFSLFDYRKVLLFKQYCKWLFMSIAVTERYFPDDWNKSI